MGEKMRLAIYGAQGIAFGAYKAIKEIFPDKEVLCFLVTEMKGNTSMLGDIPVMELQDFIKGAPQNELDDVEVLIATPENVMKEIEENLKRAGIRSYVRLDSRRWADMMRNAFVKSGKYMPLTAYTVGCKRSSLHVFRMMHFNDRPLKTLCQRPDYVSTLQVGSAASPEAGADMRDDTGDNISGKNGNYSELTGLYWIWKNYLRTRNDDDYYGLEHYRRLLHLSDDEILRLKDNDIDVVLPYPMPYVPNIEAHHRRYISDDEWMAVREALSELYPEYDRAFDDILHQEYLYNYNIILAKRKVLDEYCAWLFPLLFRIEEIHDPEGKNPPNRFIGYVGENLETLYFMYHKKDLRIAHTGCRFLV